MYKYAFMNGKTKRLLDIKKLISSKKIASQEELLEKLSKKGYAITQATLSRDLKQLKVGKRADAEFGAVYVMPSEQKDVNNDVVSKYAASGFLSIEFANNLAVIKTKPGYASSIASVIDGAKLYEVIGTIAGDDTILLIPKENVSKNDVINAIVIVLPEIQDKV